MGLTLSHQSALDALRMFRRGGENPKEIDMTRIACPSPWVGKRWTMREFDESIWRWPRPQRGAHLHALTPTRVGRVRLQNVETHLLCRDLPAGSVLWLDEHATMVCPELLFLQMADSFSLPALVMLGYELCGHFSRDARNPLRGKVSLDVPAATSVERLRDYLSKSKGLWGIKQARIALQYLSNNALSPMEAVLATAYWLPSEEAGYGMGPITLNERVRVGEAGELRRTRSRYPDLSFSFAPLGINYDGADHLDLPGLVEAAQQAATAEGDEGDEAKLALEEKTIAVRAKYVDDMRRNRQLASGGRLVFPVTKEDLCGKDGLDNLTREILQCARNLFGVDTTRYERILEDTSRAAERKVLLESLLPIGAVKGMMYGRL